MAWGTRLSHPPARTVLVESESEEFTIRKRRLDEAKLFLSEIKPVHGAPFASPAASAPSGCGASKAQSEDGYVFCLQHFNCAALEQACHQVFGGTPALLPLLDLPVFGRAPQARKRQVAHRPQFFWQTVVKLDE